MDIKFKLFQAAFYKSTAPYCALISGWGTGKSHVGLLKLYNYCQKWPDSLALLLRRETSDALGSTMRDFHTYFGKEFNSRNEFEFSNGSKIMARHAKEIDALKSYNISTILWEQAEEGNQEILDQLVGRLRRQNAPYRQLNILANASGNNFLKDLFINKSSKVITLEEKTGQREYFSADGDWHAVTANSFATADIHAPDFVKRLKEMEKRSPNIYKQLILNDMSGLVSDDALFSYGDLQACKSKHALRQGYGMRLMGIDPARFGDDATAVVIIQQMGALHWEVIHVESWTGQNLDATSGRVMAIAKEWKVDRGSIDCDGLGSGVFDALVYGQRQSIFSEFRNPNISSDRNPDFGNNRTDAAFRLKGLVDKQHICITDELLINELCSALRFKYLTDGRRILVSKNELRKEGVQSPNKADALIMAVSLIDEVVLEQNTQYQPRQSQYSSSASWNPFIPEENKSYRGQPNYSPESDPYRDAGV